MKLDPGLPVGYHKLLRHKWMSGQSKSKILGMNDLGTPRDSSLNFWLVLVSCAQPNLFPQSFVPCYVIGEQLYVQAKWASPTRPVYGILYGAVSRFTVSATKEPAPRRCSVQCCVCLKRSQPLKGTVSSVVSVTNKPPLEGAVSSVVSVMKEAGP